MTTAKHFIIAKASTPVFDGEGNGGCSGKKLTVINEVTTLPVRRVHYLKDGFRRPQSQNWPAW
jgi:hypothetical protein